MQKRRDGRHLFCKGACAQKESGAYLGVFLNEEEQGGGPLIDIGTHALDLTLWMMDNYEVASVTGAVFHKLSQQTDQGNAFGNWDPEQFKVEDSAFGFIRMKNGALIELESACSFKYSGCGRGKNKHMWNKGRSGYERWTPHQPDPS
ncbi:MAG: Gfo/Idh/MocA family oxidoreductase [Mediterraneibacter gnavus]